MAASQAIDILLQGFDKVALPRQLSTSLLDIFYIVIFITFNVALNCRIGLSSRPSELADPDQSLSHDQIEARFQPNLEAAPDLVGPLQYADDTNTITAPHQVGDFLQAMSTFAGATGQHLNLDKTHLLPIGALPADLPSQEHGLQVVSQASILGLTFHQGTAAPTANWGHNGSCRSNACKDKRL